MRKIVFAAVMIAVFTLSATAFAGQIVMDGSTTVLPFGQVAAEQFSKQNPNVKFSVSGTGTGNGFKSLAEGGTQIANASRFIKDSEIKACMDKKVYPVPFAVALDCLVPVVHPSNPLKSLTKAQLKDIYSGKITNWKEVGGSDAPIAVIGRDTSSGTYGTWQEMIMDAGGKTRVTPRAQVMASSGAMMTAVAQNRKAIGYEGMGYISKSVKTLAIDGVAGTAAGARSGKYPLSRYLFMFTNSWPKGDVLAFINYMQSPAGQKIVNSTGFVSLQEMK